MAAFFIFLIMIFIIIAKSTGEKASEASFNYKHQVYDTEKARLERELTPTNEKFFEIRNFVYNADKNLLCEHFKDDFEYIYGADYESELKSGAFDDYEWLQRLVLSYSGCVDSFDITAGYKFVLSNYPNLRINFIHLKYLQCIEKHLNEHGKNIKYVLMKHEIYGTLVQIESLLTPIYGTKRHYERLDTLDFEKIRRETSEMRV